MHWPGLEPGPPAWQASILPLNHQCLHIDLNKKFNYIYKKIKLNKINYVNFHKKIYIHMYK